MTGNQCSSSLVFKVLSCQLSSYKHDLCTQVWRLKKCLARFPELNVHLSQRIGYDMVSIQLACWVFDRKFVGSSLLKRLHVMILVYFMLVYILLLCKFVYTCRCLQTEVYTDVAGKSTSNPAIGWPHFQTLEIHSLLAPVPMRHESLPRILNPVSRLQRSSGN